MSKLDALFATGETVTGKQYMKAMLEDLAESRAASMYEERMTKLMNQFKVEQLSYEKIESNNTPIDLTTKSEQPSLESVRAAIQKLDGLSYTGRSSTGWRWEMDRTRKPEDSTLHKAYGSKVAKLEYEVSR